MSTVNPISSNITNLVNGKPLGLETEKITAGGSNFSEIFTQAFESVVETDQADKASMLELLSGTSDSMAGLMIDAQKAEISLNLALQLRSKVLDAYKEIMSMQV